MKNRKLVLRIFALLGIVLASVFAFTSCDNDDDDEKNLPQISVNLKNLTNNWRAAMAYYAQGSIWKYGLTPYYLTSAKDGEEQARQVQMAVNSAVRVIILSPEGISTEEVNAAIKRRIPVILLEEEMDVEYTALVQGDNAEAGRNAATFMADKAVNEIAVFRVAQDPISSNLRVTNFLTTARQLPGRVITEVTLDKYTRADGRKFTRELLVTNPGVEAIYAQDDEIALGVLDALSETPGHKVKVLVGCGGAQEYLTAIMTNTSMDLATTLYSPSMISKCVEMAAEIISGKEPRTEKEKIIMPATLIDRKNVNKHLDRNSPH